MNEVQIIVAIIFFSVFLLFILSSFLILVIKEANEDINKEYLKDKNEKEKNQ